MKNFNIIVYVVIATILCTSCHDDDTQEYVPYEPKINISCTDIAGAPAFHHLFQLQKYGDLFYLTIYYDVRHGIGLGTDSLSYVICNQYEPWLRKELTKIYTSPIGDGVAGGGVAVHAKHHRIVSISGADNFGSDSIYDKFAGISGMHVTNIVTCSDQYNRVVEREKIVFQNEPNPFSDSTVIRYCLPTRIRGTNETFYLRIQRSYTDRELIKHYKIDNSKNKGTIVLYARDFEPGSYCYFIHGDDHYYGNRLFMEVIE